MRVVGEVSLNLNPTWSAMEMAILRHYASTTRCTSAGELILVANGPVNHFGGEVNRRWRDALYRLTALQRRFPAARMLTRLGDPAVPWPSRRCLERKKVKWPAGTDFGAIDVDLFDRTPPLALSLFRAPPFDCPWAFAVCHHITVPRAPRGGGAPGFARWRAREHDLVYAGSNRSPARQKRNALFLGDPQLKSVSYGISPRLCAGWRCHEARPRIAMGEVCAAHERARFSLITGDPRHASWQVGYTIRVLQTLETGALCAFHPEFPREFIFDGNPRADMLAFESPAALAAAIRGMTEARYRELLALQREAARRCRRRAAAEDPLARLWRGAAADRPPSTVTTPIRDRAT